MDSFNKIGITKTICRNTGIVDDNIILHQSKHSMTCVHVHYSFLRFKNLFLINDEIAIIKHIVNIQLL